MDKWFIFPADLERQQSISKALGISPATAQILINRGINTPEKATCFLKPDMSQIPGSGIFPDMERAVDRIISALENNEKIAIYGDYDVDGLTGVAMLVRFFKAIGSEPLVFIPNRLTEGYGLHISAIEKLKEEGVSLIITVDCGTNAIREIEFAKSINIDFIITDHHEVGEKKHETIFLNPKHSSFVFSDKDIAGCSISFFLLKALAERLKTKAIIKSDIPDPTDYLDLVALGTVADVVPLTGLNRVFAKFGLQSALSSKKPGIESLIKVCGLKGDSLKAVGVAFRLAPRINAAGRLGKALKSLELLVTDDKEIAREVAYQLDNFNFERQTLEKHALKEALKTIEDQNLISGRAIVVSSGGWHPGVIGIVASKLAEKYCLPAAVISFSVGRGKGSVRSAAGLNAVKMLGSCSEALVHFGGHEKAAGFTIEESNIDAFRLQFETACRESWSDQIPAELFIDSILTPSEITPEFVNELESLEPFGEGNPEPLFLTKDFVVNSVRRVGENHLKIKLSHPSFSGSIDAIAFGMADRLSEFGQKTSFVYTPQINEWEGLKSIQLKIKDFYV